MTRITDLIRELLIRYYCFRLRRLSDIAEEIADRKHAVQRSFYHHIHRRSPGQVMRMEKKRGLRK